MKMMYTVKQGSKTVGLSQRKRHYIVGFENLSTVRKVQYSMHPEPELTLLRGDGINLEPHFQEVGIRNIDLVLDVEATLFIPKYKGNHSDPMNEGNYHIGLVKYEDFVMYPFTNSLGIILPYELKDEDENEFMFKSHVIEPTFNALFFY